MFDFECKRCNTEQAELMDDVVRAEKVSFSAHYSIEIRID